MTSSRTTYHEDADIVELFFDDEMATASVNLTPDIILHFQVENRRPISLIFNNFSYLAQADADGLPAFRLEMENWPIHWRKAVSDMLAQSPLNEWITLTSYHPAHQEDHIPLLMIQANPLSVA